MSFKDFTDSVVMKTSDFCRNNSNDILTVVSLVSFGAALYFTAKDAVKADAKLKDKTEEKGEKLTLKEKVVEAVPEYIPAAVASAVTVGSILLNRQINEDQKAALAGTAALLSASYGKYKQTVVDVCGEEKAREIDAVMAKTSYIKQRGGKYQYVDDLQDASSDVCIFYDPLIDLYFNTTINQVRQAQYHINRIFALKGDVSLFDYYDYLGILDSLSDGEKDGIRYLGWSQKQFNVEDLDLWIDFNNEYVDFPDDEDEIDAPHGYYVTEPLISAKVIYQDALPF